MLLLQFSIGALNDWADAAADAGRAAKPIPAGLVGRDVAFLVAVACGAVGVVLSATAGLEIVAIAAAGLAVGYAYDLGLKGTAGAWLSFAAGFVLLPLFAWAGARAGIPAFLPWIVALALPAGAVVSLANAFVDIDGDRAAGRRSPVVMLGRDATLRGILALDLVILAGAAGSLAVSSAAAPAVAWVGVVAGGGLSLAGWWVSRGSARRARLDGWHLQAVGLAILAAAWFAGMAT
jgi:4-hydroxybenzoate polyprenyltransferase